jgi:chemotaxis protein methyltransferase CheR
LRTPAGADELRALVEAVRVGETRFFRHHGHIQALQRVVLPELMERTARERRPLRVWSAGCATGEEPYTLAILIAETSGGHAPGGTEVLATDVSAEALAFATRGRYPVERLGAVPPSTRERFLVEVEPGLFEIAPIIRQLVRFEQHNLLSAQCPPSQDLIVCRNVLIYFDDPARERTLRRLAASLEPGGYLLLGASESARSLEADGTLAPIRTRDGLVYHRPPIGVAIGAALASASSGGSPVHVAQASSRRAASSAPPPPPPSDLRVVDIKGALHEPGPLQEALREHLGRARWLLVTLDGADFLADELAVVLRRAATAQRHGGGELLLVVERPGARRWIDRHGLTNVLRCFDDREAALRAMEKRS